MLVKGQIRKKLELFFFLNTVEFQLNFIKLIVFLVMKIGSKFSRFGIKCLLYESHRLILLIPVLKFCLISLLKL